MRCAPQMRGVMLWGADLLRRPDRCSSCSSTARSCARSPGTRRWRSSRACRSGIVYLPIPIAGLLTLLFLVERLWVGAPPPTSVMYSDQPTDLE